MRKPHKSPSGLFLPRDVIALCSTAVAAATAAAAAAFLLATRVTGSRQSSQEETRKEGRRGGKGKGPEITNYRQTPSKRFLTVPMSSGEKCGVLSSERRRDGERERRVQLHNERLQLDNLAVISHVAHLQPLSRNFDNRNQRMTNDVQPVKLKLAIS